MNGGFFVGVKSPVDTRKDLLSCSKTLITSLIKLEHYKEVRAQKRHHMSELKGIMNDLVSLDKKLRARLPKSKTTLQKTIQHDHPGLAPLLALSDSGETKKPGLKIRPPIKKKTRLDQLRAELDQLEEKIKVVE